MKTTSLSSISLLLALGASVAGCAASAPDYGDGNGGGGGSGSQTETPPLSAEGKYSLLSDYDLATNAPGTAGTIANAFIQATDDPDDPCHWILDQLVAQLPDGSFKNTVKGAIPFVAGYLNDRLLEVAPDFVVTIRDIGNKFGQMARHFGTLDTLEVPANGMGTHTVGGVHFVVDQVELDYLFKDYQLAEVTVPNVAVTMDKFGKLTIAEHKVPLSYGKILRLGLDEVIIPLVDPTAVTLADILHNLINCQAVGQYVYDAIGIGSPSTFQSACNTGINVGAQALYQQIGKIDASALEFDINGVAKGVDKNHDGKMDSIQTGGWAGTLSYSGAGAPLAHATFAGERM